MEPVLSVRNLKTYFDTEEGTVKAVDGMDYDLDAGETLGIVGESGCGKSVHALSILGLIPNPPGKIVGGEIIFRPVNKNGKQGAPLDLARLSNRQMRDIRGVQIAMIFQEPMTSLNPVLTAGEQIAESIRFHEGLSAPAAWGRAQDLLAQVGIPNPQKRIFDYPYAFSGGMRQRVMIAIALALKPNILIADEPTTALDVTVQAQILDLMKQMQKAYNMALILITHNMGVVAEYCDEAIVMYAGKPVEKAAVNQLFSRPSHPYTWGLLNSIPKLNQSSDRLEPIEGQPPNLAALENGCAFAPRCSFAWPHCRSDEPALFACGNRRESRCWLQEKEIRKGAPKANWEKAQQLLNLV